MPTALLNIFRRPRFRKYADLVRRDLAATYSRDLHKWLVVAPIVGVVTGLVTAGLTVIILNRMWKPLLRQFLLHPWLIAPVVAAGMAVAGAIMQFLTPDPDEHSTEEIIRCYHHGRGAVNMRPFVPKLLAAIATVGTGGSAALEGPGIYSGGALGSWLWARLRGLGLGARDRRLMLICGAAAGMAAVFRAPLTGIIFALEMPYQDDLAHEALVPALIASVVSYITLISIVGSAPLFQFPADGAFSRKDLLWSALLGAVCGLIVMVFTKIFRRFRAFMVRLAIPHWTKLAAGGLLTSLCGLFFIAIYPGSLIPLGPNYEAVGNILNQAHAPAALATFGVLKLAATLFTLGTGGVSAMFVPLFLSGESFGKALAMLLPHSPSADLFAAVGMAAFIAGGYKTPLAAVVFVAEAAGGHAYIIPALIGSAVAYAVSGEVTVSSEQELREEVSVERLDQVCAAEVMQREVATVPASTTLSEFADYVRSHPRHAVFPVLADESLTGTASIWSLGRVEREKWPATRIGEIAEREFARVPPDCDLQKILKILTSPARPHMVLAVRPDGPLEGVVTKTDILDALRRLAAGAAPSSED